MATRAAGYSGTPLVRKLGLKAGMTVQVVDAPAPYERLVGSFACRLPGFVDVKGCAIDATWSGLKLVVRREPR